MGIIGPQGFAGGRIQRQYLPVWRAQIKPVGHFNRRGFKIKFAPFFIFPRLHDIAGVDSPGWRQTGNVSRSELCQRRVTFPSRRAAIIVPILAPGLLWRALRRRRQRRMLNVKTLAGQVAGADHAGAGQQIK